MLRFRLMILLVSLGTLRAANLNVQGIVAVDSPITIMFITAISLLPLLL